MPHKSSLEATKAPKITPASYATNPDFERFFGNCGDDTRRKIFRFYNLPKRKKRPWSEFWNAVGLDPRQPKNLWDELTLGSSRKNVLWDAARVAEETGYAVVTMNGYCHKNSFPEGFPQPLINVGAKTRLWLPLEVCAYNRPSIYAARAAMIRRKPQCTTAPKKADAVAYTGTMQPLPSQTRAGMMRRLPCNPGRVA